MLAIHDEQIAEHGGGSGIRDRGLLESAMARLRNQFAHGKRSLARLAGQYAFGLSRNHPFIDGNKRTSRAVLKLLLVLNGHQRTATDADCVTPSLGLAAGDVTEDQLSAWAADHIAQAQTRQQQRVGIATIHAIVDETAPTEIQGLLQSRTGPGESRRHAAGRSSTPAAVSGACRPRWPARGVDRSALQRDRAPAAGTCPQPCIARH